MEVIWILRLTRSSETDSIAQLNQSLISFADTKYDKMRRLLLEVIKERKRDEILNDLLLAGKSTPPKAQKPKKKKNKKPN